MIVEEGGVPPLLKLWKERASPESQIVAARVFLSVGNDPRMVKLIAREPPVRRFSMGVGVIRFPIKLRRVVGRSRSQGWLVVVPSMSLGRRRIMDLSIGESIRARIDSI
ncbi:hypothetical protein LOK49_Contig202G00009 [Camellia lanceoleosa]|nr:hypothetical protein LOK49_Contig202G00009 [Camellia lanceoleosa]